MKRIYSLRILVLFSVFGVLNLAYGQTIITLQPDATEGKDAYVWDYYPDNNLGSTEEFSIYAWTYEYESTIRRGFIDFDFSQIPQGAIIDSAKLTLYNWANSTSTGGEHSMINGTNEMMIHRIVQSWDEQTITWNNQPGVTALNEVLVPSSTDGHQTYSIDVSTLVQDIIDDIVNSYGFRLKLLTEEDYLSVILASSDNIDSLLHPKIEISYTHTGVSENSSIYDDISIYPNPFINEIYVESQNFDNRNVKIETSDLYGNILFSGALSDKRTLIDMSSYANGIYLIKITYRDSVMYEKVLKL